MKAKKNPKLEALAESFHGRLPKVHEEVLGKTYTLELLLPEASDWVNANTSGSTTSAMLFSSKRPLIAAALRAIDFGDGDGAQTVAQLFEPGPDMDTKVVESATQAQMTEWRRDQILAWMKTGLDNYVIERLYAAYTAMQRKHNDDLRALENFAKRTSS